MARLVKVLVVEPEDKDIIEALKDIYPISVDMDMEGEIIGKFYDLGDIPPEVFEKLKKKYGSFGGIYVQI